jgi:cysteine desulfurase/selenocysteine lyase
MCDPAAFIYFAFEYNADSYTKTLDFPWYGHPGRSKLGVAAGSLQRMRTVSAASMRAETPASVEEMARDWIAFRAAFPTTESFTYLDTARKGLVPLWVEQAMRDWMADIYQNAGFKAFSMEEIEIARAEIAKTFGAPAQCLALIKNTSEGMNIIAQGLGIKPGENVVISANEHENNTLPWRYLARKGVDVRILAAGDDGAIPLFAYETSIDAKTRAVSVAWVSYGAGIRSNIAEIAALAHRQGAFLVVDGIQGAGIINLRVDSLGADAVVCGGHKALISLAGAGFLYMREEAIRQIAPPYAAKFSFTSLDRTIADLQLASDAHRFEYGNPNFLGIWVQQHSARIIRRVGLDRIEQRVKTLSERLISGLDAIGIRVRTPREWERRAGIVSIDFRKDAREIIDLFAKQRIILSDRDGFVRASLYACNNEADIDRFLNAAEALKPIS